MAYENWYRVLVHAFLGEDPGVSAAADVATVLAARRAEITAVRDQRRDAGLPWPLPPPADLAAGLPWAHYAAWVAQLRRDLDLDSSAGGQVQPPERPGHPDREVERLRADRPPHWA